MPVTSTQVTQLRAGAREAHAADVHRLGHLLNSLADVAQMIHDGSDLDVAITLPDIIERGVRVARDVCRSTDHGRAADTTDTTDTKAVA